MYGGESGPEANEVGNMNGPEGVRADPPADAPAPPADEQARVEAAARESTARGRFRLPLLEVRNLGLLGVLVLLILAGSFTKPAEFLTYDNVVVILTLASVSGVITVGMTFVIIGGGIDLSVGAIVALATVWATTQATQLYGTGGVIFCALAVGVGCGLVNGLMIAYGRIVAFIMTIAMLASARGLAINISSGHTQTLNADNQTLVNLGYKDNFLFGRIPPLVIMFAAVVVVGWVVLNRTTFGRRTFAIGGNQEAARLAGLNVRMHTLLLYVLSGLCCGVASLMLIVLTASGTSANGNLYELDAIAAVIIGGTLLSGGRGTLVGSVLGVLVFTTINDIFTLNNLTTATQQVAKGVIIVIAVLVQRLVAERRAGADPV
ncbi:ABC transporter permease [Actinoallomurus bryophytorum]|uniref:Ribose transport system permease protein n=2 Tax=Actinoallomurus bryophytorum TaxID=1490222 RepID=A0A543CQ45_9ACTN|nr:ribose transport system permease protein [Actinoallomurus bryophytorum]